MDLGVLHPEFKPLVMTLLTHVAHLASLSSCRWYVASAYRSPEKQMELYKKGRKLVGVDWVLDPITKINRVTNARPEQTPHCITTPEGKPASCAVDIALVELGESPTWLDRKDPRWGIIGAAIGLSRASSKLLWGGQFDSIRDFPHVELRNWRKHVISNKKDI